ncbi:hypothetical protein BDL97_07G102300 [Sphagnum fallax]|nr:hypothetical protein BDL97_07G102300 [Sphagnum fallax]
MITAGLISGKRPLLEMGLSEGISPSYNSHRGDGLLAGFRPQGREGGDDSHFNLCKRLVFVFGCAEDYYASVSCKGLKDMIALIGRAVGRFYGQGSRMHP